MLITISGYPGSGKSTVGKLLTQKLGYQFISVGDLRGELAKKHGMTINQLNKVGETADWTDKEVDQMQKDMATKDKIIFDSRLGFHFIPKSLKIFLTVDFAVGAKRMMDEKRNAEEEEIGQDIPNQVRLIKERIASDNIRYKKYYGASFDDQTKFDLWIDTTSMTPQQVVQKIMLSIPTKDRSS